MTVGPWRPVAIHGYTTRIADLRALPVVNDDYSVELNVKIELSNSTPGAKANVNVKKLDGSLVIGQQNVDVSSGKCEAQFKFSKGALDLWYPVGYGKQPLYRVEVEILSGVSPFPLLIGTRNF
jgi:beta-mannosidase